MVIKYWTDFSKREDETLLPTGTGTPITVTLKEPCSILRPSFILSSNISGLNYIRVDNWGRYYFVTEKTYISNDTYRIDCVYDPLASYKTQIGSYTGYIEYTSSSSDITITDPRNVPSNTFDEKKKNLLDLASYGFGISSCFVVGIAGGSGGVTYYVMSDTALEDFYDEVYDKQNFIDNIENQFYGIRDCVVSCRWLPYTPAGTDTQIKIGDKWLTTHGFKINSRVANILEGSYDIDFPSDDLGLGTNYLDFPPYSTGTLYLPYVGVVPIDLGIVGKSKQIRLAISIDNYTSDIIYKIANESGDVISTYSGNCGVNIPISATQNNPIGATTGTLSVIGGIASMVAGIASQNAMLGVSGALSAAGGGVGVASSMSVHTQVNGAMSSALATEIGVKIIATVVTRRPSFTVLTSPTSISGMPYYKTATISSLSGYVKCLGASVRIAGFKEEKDAVNSYLNKGFYYT